MYIFAAMLICCSSPHISGVRLMCGENLTHPEPHGKSEFGGSRAALDNCLPWYTSGFK